MTTAFEHLVLEAVDVEGQAAWWAAALGWSESYRDEHEVDLDAPAGDPPMRLVLLPVDSPKTRTNRVHLDLRSRDVAHQRETVDRLLALGATRADVGQGPVPWQVLRDPEGNELCVLEPREPYAAGAVAAVVMKARDAERELAFWAAATGWLRLDTALPALRSPGGVFLEMYPDDELPPRTDRLHLDVRPLPGRARDAEVARLVALGASPIDVGQGDAPWEVMADPEGNAFCVLSTPPAAGG